MTSRHRRDRVFRETDGDGAIICHENQQNGALYMQVLFLQQIQHAVHAFPIYLDYFGFIRVASWLARLEPSPTLKTVNRLFKIREECAVDFSSQYLSHRVSHGQQTCASRQPAGEDRTSSRVHSKFVISACIALSRVQLDTLACSKNSRILRLAHAVRS